MRLPTMSSNFLLAPIPESADYFTVRDIKMAVMGASSVGKTVMLCLTFVQMDDDISQVADMLRCVQSAEGFLLVYSITDYRSYEFIRHLHQHIRKVHSDTKTPIIIVANKGDLLHVRQVTPEAGIQLATELGCAFVEISTSENCQDVCEVFHHLCKEVSKHQSAGSGDKRRGSIIPRPKSPNMQDLKRRFKQALSPKVKTSSAMA
ncbi:ras-like protein family member 11A [Anomaloglossus baeobatrachus]|uniref:ras-like protein family member 11A n=1 Tax=Anomaloglossus baeobatrachus TaxID=238106 RepID=UPI003F504BF4